jgi:beta-phosphoglucomutase-like phosphatase (HAD superfamily)
MPDLHPGVLFDVGGTLLEPDRPHVLAWWQAAGDTGPGLATRRATRDDGVPRRCRWPTTTVT